MKTITVRVNEMSEATAPLPATDGRTASQLLALLLGGTAPTEPVPPIPFSHRGIAMGDWAALEAATLAVEPDDRASFDSKAPSDQPARWVEIVDKQFRRAED